MCRSLSHLPANKSGIIHEWQRTLGELVSSVPNHKNSRRGGTSSFDGGHHVPLDMLSVQLVLVPSCLRTNSLLVFTTRKNSSLMFLQMRRNSEQRLK